jgi:putative transcriptional regulator
LDYKKYLVEQVNLITKGILIKYGNIHWVMNMKSRIGEWIDLRGYRRKYIANLMGVSQNQLSNWVTGRSYPTAEKLFKLAKVLDCKVDEMYEKED